MRRVMLSGRSCDQVAPLDSKTLARCIRIRRCDPCPASDPRGLHLLAIDMTVNHWDSTAGDGRRWLIYALGGGMGHLTRAVALARASAAHSDDSSPPRVCLLTNSPFADRLPLESQLGAGQCVVRIDPQLGRLQTARRVAEVFQQTPPEVLIVDTFPRGLGGELAEVLPTLGCHKVLVHRDLNPRYVAHARLETSVAQFDRLLVPGEPAVFENQPHAVRTAPWLIRDADALLPVAAARRMLEVASNTLPVVAVIGCGKREEVEQMRSVAQRLAGDCAETAAVRFVTPLSSGDIRSDDPAPAGPVTVNVWPFLDVIRGVSLIVGSGGYNTVHEARVTGTRLIGWPRRRLYDRQHRRLREDERSQDVSQIARRVVAALGDLRTSAAVAAPGYQNGTAAAVAAIESLYR